jgi:hypothetical protein
MLADIHSIANRPARPTAASSGRDKLEWLIVEVAHLRRDHDDLLQENHRLRERLTLIRLLQGSAAPPDSEQVEGRPAP